MWMDEIMTKHQKRVLVVEDDKTLNRLLVEQLTRLGFEARGASSRAQALETLEQFEPSLIILDVRLPDTEGMSLLLELHEVCPVVVLTAYGSVTQAVKAVKAGAAEYLIKPVSPHSLELAVSKALETAALKRNAQFWQEQARPDAGPQMIGNSPAFAEVSRMIGLVAPADTTVLIEGESGVGKELVAQSVHSQSPRSSNHIVAIDCCTLQENLFESELFGHERGAFTGAERKKEGLIEVAESGTVFLDEIGEISPAIQAKLLRVLETGQFRRLGGTRDLVANVRFIAATNRSLQEMVSEGTFRSDLYYRLSAFIINVPPLRQRKGDVELIAEHFLQTRKFLRNADKKFTPQTLKALAGYNWPGNARELRNVVERSILISAESPLISPQHISLPKLAEINDAKVQFSFDHEPTLEEIRSFYLAYLLETHNGNRLEVSKALGMSERNTYRLIKKLGFEQ
jgi:DNA-binding NtrC family response regulator